jgi:hypothetical protein
MRDATLIRHRDLAVEHHCREAGCGKRLEGFAKQ